MVRGQGGGGCRSSGSGAGLAGLHPGALVLELCDPRRVIQPFCCDVLTCKLGIRTGHPVQGPVRTLCSNTDKVSPKCCLGSFMAMQSG